ncbi:hypothetical protein LTR36_007159 [Oleoguttula mirabilis]|uniref:Uncharacterized protein n=1 Tax=Oleoguttula mirabilis TaxID=1507867 RepID=A0AAV9JAB8_9PEZI|nr:hypothetical protein LTR36_007159 [Oleoguttula mirabilis]
MLPKRLENAAYEWCYGDQQRVPTGIFQNQQQGRNDRYVPFGVLDFTSGQPGGSYYSAPFGYGIDQQQRIHDMEPVSEQQRWQQAVRDPTYNPGPPHDKRWEDMELGYGAFGTLRLWLGSSAKEGGEGAPRYDTLPRDYYLSDDPNGSGMVPTTIDFDRRFYPDEMGW